MPLSCLVSLALLLAAPAILPAQTAVKKPPHPAHAGAISPLTEREKAAQLLNRFTFGARPGEIDAVMKAGTQNWPKKPPKPMPDVTKPIFCGDSFRKSVR